MSALLRDGGGTAPAEGSRKIEAVIRHRAADSGGVGVVEHREIAGQLFKKFCSCDADNIAVRQGLFRYGGILDKAGRTEEETEAVKAFAEWFGSAETQAAWGEEFDSYPCNTAAADILYPDGIPAIYTLKNFALTKVDGTDMTYAEYVAEHSSEWTNIMTNLGFYWADASAAVAEPDWANLDWATLTQKAA